MERRRPIWSADGAEMFFDRDDAQLYIVRLHAGSTVTAGVPMALPIKGFIQGVRPPPVRPHA